MKKKILLLTAYYEPGYKSGGPVRSISMLVKNLDRSYNFFIVTTNRDYGDTENYPGIKSNRWHKRGLNGYLYINATLPDQILSPLKNVLNKRFDCIYINNFFSLQFSIIPLICIYLLGGAKKVPVLIAPRGQFSPDALKIKSIRKKVFLFLLKATVLKMKKILFQATCEEEKKQIADILGKLNKKIFFAPNFGSFKPDILQKKFNYKKRGVLSIVYIGRVSVIKNIGFAFDVLQCIDSGEIQFDIYGPCTEAAYLETLHEKMKTLPSNVKVAFYGDIAHSEVPDILLKYDLFFSPSKSENFGHSLIEALSHGIPLLIGDNTPWKGLPSKFAGWDLPVDDKSAFVSVVESMVNMDNEEFQKLHYGALSYIQTHELFCSVMELNEKMFQQIFAESK